MASAALGASCAVSIAGRARSSADTTRTGTHPMIVTTERDWGGWRIFMKLLEEFVDYADQEPENLSDDLTKLAQIARRIISEVSQ
jgi:hypothetical protein